MARMNNSIVSTNSENQKFSVAIQGSALQGLIAKATPDAQSAARLTGSLISVVAENSQLQACTPASIVAAALRGEGMGLMLGQGYYVVPYGNTARLQIGYKGLIAMAIAGGDVADMDCVEIREGEYVGRNRRTKRPEFDFSVYATDEEAEQHPIIGYYAYVEKRDGFFRAEYMSIGAILDHAERYSKTFDRRKYQMLVSGELSRDDAERLMQKSPWYSASETMMKKTVIRKLLNSGYVVLNAVGKMQAALATDDENNDAENALAAFDVVSVDEHTGELRSESVQEPAQVKERAEPTPDTTEAPTTQERGRKPKTADADQEAPQAQDVEFTPVDGKGSTNTADGDDVIGSIFG